MSRPWLTPGISYPNTLAKLGSSQAWQANNWNLWWNKVHNPPFSELTEESFCTLCGSVLFWSFQIRVCCLLGTVLSYHTECKVELSDLHYTGSWTRWHDVPLGCPVFDAINLINLDMGFQKPDSREVQIWFPWMWQAFEKIDIVCCSCSFWKAHLWSMFLTQLSLRAIKLRDATREQSDRCWSSTRKD